MTVAAGSALLLPVSFVACPGWVEARWCDMRPARAVAWRLAVDIGPGLVAVAMVEQNRSLSATDADRLLWASRASSEGPLLEGGGTDLGDAIAQAEAALALLVEQEAARRGWDADALDPGLLALEEGQGTAGPTDWGGLAQLVEIHGIDPATGDWLPREDAD